MNLNQAEWRAYRSRASETPLLDAEREHAMLRLAQHGDERATRELVESHMRLVVQVASSYARDGLSVHDLVSEGVVGLMEAIRRFDVSRPVRFASYASFWVRARVRQHALANRRIVGMPDTRGARLARARMREAERELRQTLGRAPTRAELAAKLGVSETDVELVEAALSTRDVAISHGDGSAAFDPSDERDGPEQAVANAEAEALCTEHVRRALTRLDARERALVCEHLCAEEGQSLAQLGRSLGVSRQRAGQILAGAREKLRVELACIA